MKGKFAIILTLTLVGMTTQVTAQSSDDRMFSAPPSRQSLGGSSVVDVGRVGPLTLELNDQTVDGLRKNGAMQAPIDPRDVPNVNQIVFGYPDPMNRLEQERNFGLIDPVSKSNRTLVFEFKESDLRKIQNTTLRYQLAPEEMGRFDAVEIVYRGASRDHSASSTVNQPIESTAPGFGGDSMGKMQDGDRWGNDRSQDNRLQNDRPISDRVINPPSNEPPFADSRRLGTAGRNDARDRSDAPDGRDNGLSRLPIPPALDDFSTMRRNDRSDQRDDRSDGVRTDQRDTSRSSLPAWQRDSTSTGFGTERGSEARDSRSGDGWSTDSRSGDFGSRDDRRSVSQDGDRGREIRDSAAGLQSLRSDQWDALERKMDTLERLRRELLADKRDFDREKDRFAQQQEQWQRNRDISSNLDGRGDDSSWGSGADVRGYDDKLMVLKNRLESIERQNRRLQDENRDLMGYLNRYESDDRSYTAYNRNLSDRWSNRVEPRPTNRQGLESLQASLPGTSRLVDNRDPNAEGRSKRDIGILFSLLIGSLALNLYLAWISRGFYVRYSELADELRETFASSV